MRPMLVPMRCQALCTCFVNRPGRLWKRKQPAGRPFKPARVQVVKQTSGDLIACANVRLATALHFAPAGDRNGECHAKALRRPARRR